MGERGKRANQIYTEKIGELGIISDTFMRAFLNIGGNFLRSELLETDLKGYF